VHFIVRAKSFLIPTVHSYPESVRMKYRLDLQLLFRRHFPWPIPFSVEIWYMVIFYCLVYTSCSLSVWTLVLSLASITDTHALFYEYLHQLVKPHLLNIFISILNCHSGQFSHSVSTKVTLLIAVFVSVDQPRYKWNLIITVSYTSKFI
jgi:hypothetical protein